MSLLTAIARADTFYVNGTCGDDAWTGRNAACQAPDGPKRSIYYGVLASAPGDTIIVADGVYTGIRNTRIEFGGRELTLRSQNGPENCIIDCLGGGRAFYLRSGEGRDSVIEGLTIRGGYAPWGGAIYCENAGPTIRNCIIAENIAYYTGGGIFCEAGDILIEGCTITNNVGEDHVGGVDVYDGDVAIVGCTITDNRANNWAGGLQFARCNITIEDCNISRNRSERGGGGIYGRDSENVSILRCTIADNVTDGRGGGVWINEVQSLTIADSTLARNVELTGIGGGGLYCSYTDDVLLSGCNIIDNWCSIGGGGGLKTVYCAQARLEGCVVWGNTADHIGDGGGLLSYYGSMELLDCEFARNTGNDGGAAKFSGDTPGQHSVSIRKCVIADNSARNGGGIYCIRTKALIEDTNIRRNTASSEGGGAYAILNDLAVVNSTIAENEQITVGPYYQVGGAGFFLERNAPAVFLNSIIRDNFAHNCGGGILSYQSYGVDISGCTIVDNRAGALGGGVQCTIGPVHIANSILWGNQSDQLFEAPGTKASVRYSNVQAGWPGTGNRGVDPMFVDPDKDDFHLSSGSPCVNAGDPGLAPLPGETDIDRELRMWAGRVDIGADEFDSFVYGDLNCDGALNAFDIEPFILSLVDPGGYATLFPECAIQLADVNGDGLVDAFDIEALVAALLM